MSTTKEKIEIMLQHEAGAVIEWRRLGAFKTEWCETNRPEWDWAGNEYRVKPAMKNTKVLPEISDGLAEIQCKIIMHYAAGGKVKRLPKKLLGQRNIAWEDMGGSDTFNFDYYVYDIVQESPYVSMQKEADKPPTKTVQLLAWFTGNTLVYRTIPDSFECKQSGYRRVPSEDKVVEVQKAPAGE